MQEAPDNVSVHEAVTEDVVDNDDDLVKDAKKVYKPFASLSRLREIVSCSESVTCLLCKHLLAPTNCVCHSYACCLYAPLNSVSRKPEKSACHHRGTRV